MSNGTPDLARIRQARRILQRMCGRLLRPTFDALDLSATDMNLAVECLQQVDVGSQSAIWRGPDRKSIETEVLALRRAVRVAEELLRNAGKFYAGLARLMAPDDTPAHYTAGGTTAPREQAVAGAVAVHG
jgi:hypothetical protein